MLPVAPTTRYGELMEPNLSTIPLHDRAKQAEKLARELMGHLENEYLPRVREMQALIGPDALRPSGDLTVREAVRKIFAADETVDSTWVQTRSYLESIAEDLERLAGE